MDRGNSKRFVSIGRYSQTVKRILANREHLPGEAATSNGKCFLFTTKRRA